MAEKPGFFARLNIFMGEVRTELSKVVWPTQEETKTYTIVVLITTLLISSAIGLWDLGLTRLMGLIFGFNA